MRSKNLWPIAAVAVLLVPAALAEAGALEFQHVTIEDGLSQGSVDWIPQDRRGFLWFCSEDGLNRYDGRTMRVYKHRRGDANSISDNSVRHMIEAEDGVFWIATKFGLSRFDPSTEPVRLGGPDRGDPPDRDRPPRRHPARRRPRAQGDSLSAWTSRVTSPWRCSTSRAGASGPFSTGRGEPESTRRRGMGVTTGRGVPSGVYFYRISTPDGSEVSKVHVVR